jgi:hypothetical protein
MPKVPCRDGRSAMFMPGSSQRDHALGAKTFDYASKLKTQRLWRSRLKAEA